MPSTYIIGVENIQQVEDVEDDRDAEDVEESLEVGVAAIVDALREESWKLPLETK